jgi:hypothetical protein
MKNYKTRLAKLTRSRAERSGGDLSIVFDPYFDAMCGWVLGGKVGPRPEPGPSVEPLTGMGRVFSEKWGATLAKIYGGENWEKMRARSHLELPAIPLEPGVDPKVIYLERYLTVARSAYLEAAQATARAKALREEAEAAAAGDDADDAADDAAGDPEPEAEAAADVEPEPGPGTEPRRLDVAAIKSDAGYQHIFPDRGGYPTVEF